MYGNVKVSRTDVRLVSRDHAQAYALKPLPLQKDFFAPIRLNEETIEQYTVMMQATLDHALERVRKERIYGGLDDSWRNVGDMNGFKRFTKVEGKSNFYRLQGTLRTPLTKLMSAFQVNNDVELVERRKYIYGDALDGQTLYVIEDRMPEEPHRFLGIRWEAVNICPVSDDGKRDFVVLEYSGMTTDSDGNTVGFKVGRSINLKQVPSLRHEYGLVRADGLEFMLLRSTRNNHHTEIIVDGSVDLRAVVPTWVINSYLTTVSEHLQRLPLTAQTRRLASMPLLDRSEWVPVSDRRHCNVCMSRFGLLGKKLNCRLCGDVACKSCIVTRSMYSKTEKDAEEKVRFCKKCIIVSSNHDDFSGSERSGDSCLASVRSHASRSSSSSSASVFLSTPVAKTNNGCDLKYLDDAQQPRGYSSVTASESSYGSSCSYLDADMDPRLASTVEEDSVIILDTKDMARHATPSVARTKESPLNSFQSMEESIAHQRYLLQEMMSRARGFQQMRQHVTTTS